MSFQQKEIKPVHPTAIRHHGFFGETFVNQHMMMDERWTVDCLTDELQRMTDLLSKRLLFNSLESKAYRKRLHTTAMALRKQCRDGRRTLKNIITTNNVRAIRNYLINNKHLQRLYQKMPVHLVVENINQRTFVLRKERDRLNHRRKQLEEAYELKLIERARVETFIRYSNEFALDELKDGPDLMKQIENSNIRLKAINTINSTYKKMIQILRHDEIFYEPICRSLTRDIEDQATFIKHILYLGMPAISKFKQLSDEFKRYDTKSRKSMQTTVHTLLNLKKTTPKSFSGKPKQEPVLNMSKHYARETKDMLKLKTNLNEVEAVIKQIKIATLCSHAKEIFPRMRSIAENNLKLFKGNQLEYMKLQFSDFKEKFAEVMGNVLLRNYSAQEEKRLRRIQELKDQIKAEDALEAEVVAHMKDHAKIFILLRYALWNLHDILKYVGNTKTNRSDVPYSSSYLKLPLLKFEMLTMRAWAPEMFELNVKNLLSTITSKVRILVDGYAKLTETSSGEHIEIDQKQLWKEYHANFLSYVYDDEQEPMETKISPLEEDMFESKVTLAIPSRKQIKLQSAKIMEECVKKEE